MAAPLNKTLKASAERKKPSRLSNITRAEILVGDARISRQRPATEAPIITRLKAKNRIPKH